MELLKIILSCGIGAAIGSILQSAVQRHWKKKDAREEQDKIDPRQFKALIASQKLLLADRIRYLGTCYIYAKKITLEDKENLYEMHEAYKSLGGNGHLDTVMDELDKLEVSDKRKDGKG